MHFRIIKMTATSGFLTAYSAPPDLLAGLRGLTSKGKGRGKEGRGETRRNLI